MSSPLSHARDAAIHAVAAAAIVAAPCAIASTPAWLALPWAVAVALFWFGREWAQDRAEHGWRSPAEWSWGKLAEGIAPVLAALGGAAGITVWRLA